MSINPLDQKTIQLLDSMNLADLRRKVNEIVKFCNKSAKEQEKSLPNIRTLKMRKGSTPLSIYKECKKLFDCWCWYEDELKNVKSDRTCDKDYEIEFKDCVEADEDLENLSADDLKEKGIIGITLEERLQMELDYFKETGEHLDIDNVTLCSGSRCAGGHIPSVDWHSGHDELRVGRYFPDHADVYLRSRQQINPCNSVTLSLSTIEIDGVSK